MLGPLSPMCGDCASAEAQKTARQEAAIALWASQGIREIEQHLARWSAFRAWEITHCHPPV